MTHQRERERAKEIIRVLRSMCCVMRGFQICIWGGGLCQIVSSVTAHEGGATKQCISSACPFSNLHLSSSIWGQVSGRHSKAASLLEPKSLLAALKMLSEEAVKSEML